MTPEYLLDDPSSPAAEPLASAVRDLRQRLDSVLPESLLPGTPAATRATRHRWYDTFDWRLHRAGLELEHHDAGGAPALELNRSRPVPEEDGSPLAAHPVPFDAPPRFATELPYGRLRDSLAGRVAPRALLQLGDVTAQRVLLPILDAERKTVARLHVERPRLAGRTGVRLPTRVTVVPLRGYAGPAQRVAAVLSGELLASDPGRGRLGETLAAQGRRPGDYTGKLAVAVAAEQPAAAALAAILGHLQDTVDINLDGTIRAVDTEFLHDLRVAVRRARSAVKLLSGVLDPEVERQLAAELRWLGAVTGPPRDLDVLQLMLEDVPGRWPPGAADDLALFGRLLGDRAATEQARLRRALRSQRYAGLRDTIRETVQAVESATDRGRRPVAGPRAAIPVGRLGAKRLRRITHRVVQEGNAIGPDSPGEALHDLRKRCKELRYLLELLAPVFPAERHGRAVRELKALQETLGDFQDGEVQRDEVRAAAAALLQGRPAGAAGSGSAGSTGSTAALAAALLAMGRLAGELDTRQAEARAAFDERWARFTAPANLRDLAVLGGAG